MYVCMYVYIYIYTHVYTYIYIYNIGLRVEGRVSALGLGVRMEGSGWRVQGMGLRGCSELWGVPGLGLTVLRALLVRTLFRV